MMDDPRRRRAGDPSPDGSGEPDAAEQDAASDAADLAPDDADQALLDELRDAAAEFDPVPEETVLAARSMLAYLRLDAALAELTFDSLTDVAPVAVRSQAVAARQLSFDAGDFQVELEVVRDAGRSRLVGQCVPATEVEIEVHQREGTDGPASEPIARVTTDDLGRFTIEVAPGAVSLHCRWPSSGTTVATAWVTI